MAMVCVTVSGQVLQRAVGTAQEEIAYGLVSSRECGFAMTGSRGISTGAQTSVLVVGMDASGSVLWSGQHRPPEGRTRGTSIQQMSDGGYVVGAESVFGGPTLGTYLLRLNSTGGVVWSTLVSGTAFVGALNGGLGVGVGVREQGDGSIVAVSRVQGGGGSSAGVYARLQPTGVPIVNNLYSFAGAAAESFVDFADVREWRGVSNPPSDNVFVVGQAREFTAGLGFGAFVAFAARLDAAGAVTWARTYKHPVLDLAADGFCFTREGDLVLSCRVGGGIVEAGASDLALLRVRAVDGGVDWSVAATNAVTRFTNAPRGIEYLRESEEVVVAGGAETAGPVSFRNAAAAVFSATTGAFQRGRLYGVFDSAAANSAANAVAIAGPYGHVALAGRTNDTGAGGGDVQLIRAFTSLSSGCRELELVLISAPFAAGVETRQLVSAPGSVGQVFTQSGVPTLLENAACSTPRCVGDLNADGLVDDVDFSAFANAYDILVCPTNPAFTCCAADLNTDAVVDDVDFTLFAAAYNELLCP
ncbi:MAG TPA: hypothetical protein VK176_07870 [Phycisphaerales bacterium]|nr:hypothetical protein [Phycisphaerales bacterium]